MRPGSRRFGGDRGLYLGMVGGLLVGKRLFQ